MKIALDTNVLAYAEGVGEEAKRRKTHALLSALPVDNVVLPAQTLGELFRVLTGTSGIDRAKARSMVLSWSDAFAVHDSTHAAFLAAFDLAAEMSMQIWDGLILSVAAEARCRILLSEDFQHGFTWRGVTVVNPYADEVHPLIKALSEG
ncbi:PIN domain-containing protein [Steroidobacter sp. S1-65]|uniref:PIN domain-containing protein n=1 Tax=Steroidobacter gossypii TaxID=2805490 RepID=A0ABS1X0D2_9GAMM|nr:PIN domain-containing protein [Steroidobacter gossypii]MBM0106663.1 PIN domain-containing protein [Steroidobacter gossypii]